MSIPSTLCEFYCRRDAYMNAQDYWTLFLETGAPEIYLLYNSARKTEVSYAPDGSGVGPESNSI